MYIANLGQHILIIYVKIIITGSAPHVSKHVQKTTFFIADGSHERVMMSCRVYFQYIQQLPKQTKSFFILPVVFSMVIMFFLRKQKHPEILGFFFCCLNATFISILVSLIFFHPFVLLLVVLHFCFHQLNNTKYRALVCIAHYFSKKYLKGFSS